MSILSLLAEDCKVIIYRPFLRKIAGSVNGAILLSQIIYWDNKMDGKFYKFTAPCGHDRYRSGESWEEELGMSRREISKALEKFTMKLGSKAKAAFGDDYKAAQDRSLVLSFTDSSRMTWYKLNRDLLIYLVNDTWSLSIVNDTSSLTNTRSENTPEIPPNPQGGTSNDAKMKNAALEEEFNLFYASYPKKKNKKSARDKWMSKPNQKNRPKIQDLLAILDKHKTQEQWTKDGGEFIPAPNVWLNGERWDDEVTTGSSYQKNKITTAVPTHDAGDAPIPEFE